MEDDFKKRVDDIFAQLGADEKLQDEKVQEAAKQLVSSLVMLGMGFYARRQMRKTGELLGLTPEQSKQLAKTIPWAAYSVAANAKVGINNVDRLREQTDNLNNPST